MRTPRLQILIPPAALVLGGVALRAAGPGQDWAQALAGISFWLGLAWGGARGVDLLLLRAAIAARRTAPYPRLLSDLVHAACFAAAGAAILLLVFGQPALGLVTTSSVVVAVVGFALRNIIGDMFAGIALGIDAPYRIGDWVETAEGCAGRVTELSWRATRLVTRDGVALSVPNGLIAAHRLANYGAAGRYRVALRLPLDPALEPARARRILLAAAIEVERRYPGLSPDVLLQEVAEGAAIYLLRFHVPDYGQEAPCRDAVAEAALRALRNAGLAPARPGRVVRLDPAPVEAPMGEADGRAALLGRSGLFAGFAAAERAALEAAMREHVVPPGGTIVRQGEPGESLFLLAEGVLEARGPMAPDLMVPGEVFGEMSLLTGQPRSATVTAVTGAVVFELGRAALDPVLRRRPELAEGLAAIMAGRQARNARAADAAAAEAPAREDLLARLRGFFRLG